MQESKYPWEYERRFNHPGYFSKEEVQRRKNLKDKLFSLLQKNNKVACQLGCGKLLAVSECTLDHIKPLSKGGKDVIGNLTLVCECCNKMKGSMELDINLYITVKARKYKTLKTNPFDILRDLVLS